MDKVRAMGFSGRQSEGSQKDNKKPNRMSKEKPEKEGRPSGHVDQARGSGK
jgi:hypothetical protein